jgi:hypothetical protein
LIRQREPLKRGKPPARRTSLRSSGPPRARKLTPRRSERVRDADHLHRVHDLPCCARDLSPCFGPIEADHAGRRPMGRKADDDTCISLCVGHHRQRTDFSGPFKHWKGEEMRLWLDEKIAETRLLLARMTPAEVAPW